MNKWCGLLLLVICVGNYFLAEYDKTEIAFLRLIAFDLLVIISGGIGAVSGLDRK